MTDLSTIHQTTNPRETNAPEAAECVACQAPTNQVVDGQTVEGDDAWFVPLCPACHETKKAATPEKGA